MPSVFISDSTLEYIWRIPSLPNELDSRLMAMAVKLMQSSDAPSQIQLRTIYQQIELAKREHLNLLAMLDDRKVEIATLEEEIDKRKRQYIENVQISPRSIMVTQPYAQVQQIEITDDAFNKLKKQIEEKTNELMDIDQQLLIKQRSLIDIEENSAKHSVLFQQLSANEARNEEALKFNEKLNQQIESNRKSLVSIENDIALNKKELTKLELQRKICSDETTQLENVLAEMNTTYRQLELTLKNIQNQLRTEEIKLMEARADNTTLNSYVESLTRQRDDLLKQNQSIIQDVTDRKNTVEQLERQMTTLVTGTKYHETQISHESARVNEMKEASTKLENELQRKSDELLVLDKEVREKQHEVLTLEQRAEDANSKNRAIQLEYTQMERLITSTKTKTEELKLEHDRLSLLRDELTEELRHKEIQLNDIREQWTDIETRLINGEKELHSLLLQVEVRQKLVNDLQHEHSSLHEAIKALDARILTLTQSIESKEKRQGELEWHIGAISKESEEKEAHIKKLDEMIETRDKEILTMTQQLGNLNVKLVEKHAVFMQLSGELDDRRTALTEMDMTIEAKKSELMVIDGDIQQRRDVAARVVDETITVQSQLEDRRHKLELMEREYLLPLQDRIHVLSTHRNHLENQCEGLQNEVRLLEVDKLDLRREVALAQVDQEVEKGRTLLMSSLSADGDTRLASTITHTPLLVR